MSSYESEFPNDMDMGMRPHLELNGGSKVIGFAVIPPNEDLYVSDLDSALDVLDALRTLAINLSAEDRDVIYPIYVVDNLNKPGIH